MNENIPLQLNEEIRLIIGYEGLYSITSFGRVWSHIRQVKFGRGYRLCGGFLKSSLDKDKYIRVCLRKNKVKYYYRVHRLVAQAFILNSLNLPEVNHGDGNKQNNYVGTAVNNYEDGNLEWCVHEDNLNHAIENNLQSPNKRSSKYYGVYFKYDIRRKQWWVAHISYKGKRKEIGKYYTEIEAARAYDIFVIKHALNRPLNRGRYEK